MPTPELVRLAVAEWFEQLQGVTDAQIERALKDWREDWPPNAIEFRKACTGPDVNWKAYKRFPPALPRPKADPAIVAEELAKMRAALSGRGGDSEKL